MACLSSGTWFLAEVSGGTLGPILVMVTGDKYGWGSAPLCALPLVLSYSRY